MTSPATANRTGHGVDRSRHFETRRLWPAVFLAAVLGALFWRVLFMGEGLAPDGELVAWHPWADVPHATAAAGRHAYLVDQFAFFSPNEEFISRSVRRGFWPLWNPEVAHGLPTVASTQNAEYYPTNLLLWALPPFWTRGVRAILRLVACLAGTYAFGRASGMRRGGATFAALTFGFCGFNMIMLNWPITNVTLVLPCILWALERTFVTGGFASGVALALATGAALLGGHPPTVLHITVAIVAWTAYRLAVARADRLPLPALAWRLALCAAAAALIGSATLLPWREYFAQNPGAMLLLRQRRVLSWKALVSWVVPDFFGRPAFPAADWTDAYLLAGWENYVERTGYVGIAGLLLAVRGVAAMRPWHRALPWLATLAISLPIIYNAPVLGQLPQSVPVVS